MLTPLEEDKHRRRHKSAYAFFSRLGDLPARVAAGLCANAKSIYVAATGVKHAHCIFAAAERKPFVVVRRDGDSVDVRPDEIGAR